MTRAALILLASLLLTGTHDPEIRYFTNVRDIAIAAPDKQNYFAIDSEMWAHTRPDLSDIRLYDGTTQVPYILQEEKPGVATVEQEAKLLNLGTVTDHTEFDLDVGSVTQYDRLRLRVDGKDFVATALVFGQNSLDQKSRTQLGPSTLYDF